MAHPRCFPDCRHHKDSFARRTPTHIQPLPPHTPTHIHSGAGDLASLTLDTFRQAFLASGNCQSSYTNYEQAYKVTAWFYFCLCAL